MLFPVFCLRCGLEGVWVCGSCLEQVSYTETQACPVCYFPNDDGRPCVSCKEHTALVKHRAVVHYDESLLSGIMLRTLKYHFAEEIAMAFDDILLPWCMEQQMFFEHADILAPIPLHGRRYAERGFNQSALFADRIGAFFSLPVVSPKSFVRVRYTSQQARLSRAERFANVSHAFRVTDLAAFENKHVILVDDVFTTGATLHAAADAIEQAGARSVAGFTVARG